MLSLFSSTYQMPDILDFALYLTCTLHYTSSAHYQHHLDDNLVHDVAPECRMLG